MIQIDLEMPEKCSECELEYDLYGQDGLIHGCYIQGIGETDAVRKTGRLPSCPLIDVPDNNVGKISELPNSDDVFVTVEEAIDLIEKACDTWEFEYATSDEDWWSEVHKARDMAVDALRQPKIIRCEECKYRFHDAGYERDWCGRTTGVFRVNKDDFCSFAERKTDDGE